MKRKFAECNLSRHVCFGSCTLGLLGTASGKERISMFDKFDAIFHKNLFASLSERRAF